MRLLMNTSSVPPSQKSINILCFIIMLVAIIALVVIIVVKDSHNLQISKDLLILPPIIASIGITRFYKKWEKLIEILFGISGAITAISLCIDSIPNSQNNYFSHYMQNTIGYLSLSVLAALLCAKTMIMIADYINSSPPPSS